MKKILVALFVVVMALTLTLQAFAASGMFVSSPSAKSAPELIEAVNEDDACVAKVSICAYSDRDTLNDADKAKFEAAYLSIKNASDLVDLNSELGELAESLQISSDKLLVSDLFNVGYSDCFNHSDHGAFSITVKPTVIDNFVCIMYYDGSAWILSHDVYVDAGDASLAFNMSYPTGVLSKSVYVDADSATLTFNMVDPAPYAIVVHDGSAVIDDGCISARVIVGLWLVVKLVATGIVAFAVYKKSKNNEEVADN